MKTRTILARTFQRASLSWFLVPLLCGGLGASLCAGAGQKTVTLTEKDNGTTVTASPGDRILVRLPVSMGTGYGWQLEEEKKEVLPLEGKAEQEQPSESKPGETEGQLFRFVARRKGKALLEFRLVRPWEKQNRPLKTYSVAVRVR